jgi:glycosyltransferase involved in cell wall biosynthesis
VVLDGETGLLFKNDSAEDLASVTRLLLRNPARLHNMGRAGQQRAEQLFAWDRCAQEYESIYQDINQ